MGHPLLPKTNSIVDELDVDINSTLQRHFLTKLGLKSLPEWSLRFAARTFLLRIHPFTQQSFFLKTKDFTWLAYLFHTWIECRIMKGINQQKQPSRGALQSKCSENFQIFSPVGRLIFCKVAGFLG